MTLPIVRPMVMANKPQVKALFTGGTETTVGLFKYHTFTTNGTLTIVTPGPVDYIIVAGGGGGGQAGPSGGGGGGGAGGAVVGSNVMMTSNQAVVIGVGGSDAANNFSRGGIGTDSSLGAVTATGGGGGGSSRNGQYDGINGGSGGGPGSLTAGGSIGLGTSGQGNNSGEERPNYTSFGVRQGGAGGGAGGVGGDGLSTKAGGIGIEWPSGSGSYYAVGGDSAGGWLSSNASAIPANTGNGGHAGITNGAAKDGSNGVVIVRYLV